MAGSSVPRPHIPVRKDSNHYALQEDDGAPLHRSGKGKAPLREVAHPPPLSQPSTPISPSHPASAPASRTHSPTTAIPDRPTALPRPNPIPQPPAIGSPPPHPPAQIRPRTASRNAAATAGVFQQAYAYLHPFDTDPSPFGTSLKCQLCLEVFATPIRLPCCESLVCSTCVRRWLKTSRCCPWCGEVIEVAELRPEREVKKVVDELDCYCVNKRQGCDWVGPRKYLLIHVAEECLMTPRGM
ncbi:uncharacterized protein EV422DRAFT_47249 [Fimicolochytrium jonesii]|uniref:uncharacterized protein n=1 Tax=Fimicolochytrium jonesii TaxID=1396493 RepID=UPI0022FDD1B2|nr:uncharacterized protein EV422DRAFT_47249 [Fimicolochytrium jonesii]KAI8820956.1 hypothetical protein EV422DRAFT_47249 [Fimicolochytrium jonesii]